MVFIKTTQGSNVSNIRSEYSKWEFVGAMLVGNVTEKGLLNAGRLDDDNVIGARDESIRNANEVLCRNDNGCHDKCKVTANRSSTTISSTCHV